MSFALRRQRVVAFGSAFIAAALLVAGCDGEPDGRSPSAATCDLSQRAYGTLNALYGRLEKYQAAGLGLAPRVSKTLPQAGDFCAEAFADLQEVKSIRDQTGAQLSRTQERLVGGKLAPPEEAEAKRSIAAYSAAATRLQLLYDTLAQACLFQAGHPGTLEAHLRVRDAIHAVHPMIEDFRNGHLTALTSIQCGQQALQAMGGAGTRPQTAQVATRGNKNPTDVSPPAGAPTDGSAADSAR